MLNSPLQKPHLTIKTLFPSTFVFSSIHTGSKFSATPLPWMVSEDDVTLCGPLHHRVNQTKFLASVGLCVSTCQLLCTPEFMC